MATGETVFKAEPPNGSGPDANFATIDTIQGASTPKEAMYTWDFDAATQEYMDVFILMPSNYDGGGLTIIVGLSASSATTSNFRPGLAFRNIENADDFDTTAHTYLFNEVTIAVPDTVGKQATGTITFTDGSDMDNVGAGDWCVMRITRNVDHADDAASGDMEVRFVDGKET